MNDYESSQNPGRFRLVQGRIALYVLPSHPAISEAPVSVAVDGMNATAAVHKVLDDVYRVSGQRVDVWNQPLNLMKKRVRITASKEPAYEALSRIISNVDVGLSWRLLYDINMNRYYLDIYRPGVRTIALP